MSAEWPVFVINMADNTARMQKCRAALDAQDIAFERFEAVNGRALEAAEIARIYDAAANRARFRHPLVAGELGCYLSHVALWRKLVASDAAGAVLLEDDFAAAPGLGLVLQALAGDQGNWDMVKLFSRRPDARMLARRPLCDGFDLAIPYQIPNTTLGYAIRRDAAARLLQRALPIARPIDEDHKRFWEHGLTIALVQPPPLSFGEEASKGDTIQANRKAATRPPAGAVLRQGLRNLGYRLRYLAALHYHRLIGTGRGHAP
ncbi:MAG: glycosyltransferase family 25 protein [Rhodobacteraceae bacterium]|nr:glycosyltransferase family 25 protein [Paracoccaceae bacterium]